jgi:hypothetical protein
MYGSELSLRGTYILNPPCSQQTASGLILPLPQLRTAFDQRRCHVDPQRGRYHCAWSDRLLAIEDQAGRF